MKFDTYHPMINFIFFIVVMGCTLAFTHPVFIMLAYLCAFVYSIKLNGLKSFVFDLLLIPCVAAYTFLYASYNHFGVTVITTNIIDNSVTLESIVYGAAVGIRIAACLMWFSCVFAIFSSDKIIYLFGRISPRLSLFLSIILRAVPRVKQTAKKIASSQNSIGKGIKQGNILRRFRNLTRVISIVATWMLENFIESAASMKCRGYTLKGRTAFSIYRFDYRDRCVVVTIFYCISIIIMGILLNQTMILYNPEIIFNRITVLSYVFYAAYAFLCLLPIGLQITQECKFHYLKNNRIIYVNK